MRWVQKEIVLPAFSRGYHVVTNLIKKELEELKKINVGVLYIFIKHTSASLTINEDMDPTVRIDFESHMNHMVPENASYYEHVMEGADDMPAHLKNSILGSSVTIPIKNHRLHLGTWQGIYLCEHRNNVGQRKLVVNINGN